MSSISAFVTLPLLTLFSLPLALFACFTTFISIVFLILRFSVIYIELCLAIITNYFVIPTAANTSLLNFSASEPTTPAASTTPKRRSVDHSLNNGLLTALATYRPGPNAPRRTNSLTTTASTSSTQDTSTVPLYRKDEPPRNTPPRHSAPSALLTLISGDEGRDFEGLGGWRCATTTAAATTATTTTTAATTIRYPSHHLLSDTASPSPNLTSTDHDERAWLSINERLELPSQPLLSIRNNSNSSSTNSEPFEALPWRHRQMASTSPPPGGNSSIPRHHHRSATTSLLSTSLSPKSSLPDAPDHPQRRATSPPLSQKQQNRNTLFCTPSPTERFPGASIPRVSSPTDGSGGYFSFRPGSTSSTSGSTTPGEERRSPRPSAKSMVHYPAGVRYRRRSMSGPNSGVKLTRASSGTERAL
ncbi:similar to An01g02680 [Aspergillus niger]|uniref:Similar to An01g02680 n=1 Tax=Aspergillus niger TaxID=5061 RepID=A0A100I279_ASPNG|nr:similar to An01g02680 [Aspergillus niger]